MFSPEFNPYDKLLELELHIENQAYAIESLNRQLKDQQNVIRNQRLYNQHMTNTIERFYHYILVLDQQIKDLKDEKAAGRPLR